MNRPQLFSASAALTVAAVASCMSGGTPRQRTLSRSDSGSTVEGTARPTPDRTALTPSPRAAQRASRHTRPPAAVPTPPTPSVTAAPDTPVPAAAHRGRRRTNNLGLQDVTAYCQTGTMANGQQTRPGAVATLSRRIAFGTRVLIQGRIYTVMDRIGHSSDFDIWFDNCADAIQWGRRHVNVVVLP